MKSKIYRILYIIDIIYIVLLAFMILCGFAEMIHYLLYNEFYIFACLNTIKYSTINETWGYVEKLIGLKFDENIAPLPIYMNQQCFMEMTKILTYCIFIPLLFRVMEFVMSKRILCIFFVEVGVIILINVALRLFISDSVNEYFILNSLGIYILR